MNRRLQQQEGHLPSSGLLTVACWFVFITLLSCPAARGAEGFRRLAVPDQDLSLSWRVMESEHFRIIFPSRLSDTAELIGIYAEDALSLLTRWSGVSLKEASDRGSRGSRRHKIDIIVCDRSDEANGFVSMGPRGFFITLYAVHPYDSSSTGLDSYKDWYWSLLIHELAHYLHLETLNGLSLLSRRLFGAVVHPNSGTPLFHREGFASYAETALDGSFGRGSSSYTDMYLRASVEEGRFLTLDRATNDTTAWPGAQGQYLYGVSFLNYLAETAGEYRIHEFNRKSGGCIAYLWNEQFKEVFGIGMRQAWGEWRGLEEKRQTARIEELTEEGLTALRPMSEACGVVYSVALDPSGKQAAYAIRPPGRSGGLYLCNLETGRERLLEKGLYARNLAFGEGGSLLYYLRPAVSRNVYHKKDLFVLDLKKRREKRITRTGSIQGFVFLRKRGLFLLCVSTPRGTTLAALGADGGVSELLADSSLRGDDGVPFTVIEDPALSPGGEEIAFSCRTSGGERGVFVAEVSDLENGRSAFRRITPQSVRAYGPQWLSDREILYVSDEGGVYNLHRIDTLSLERERVSNVVGGLFDTRLSDGVLPSRGGMIAVKEYTARGFRASLFTLDGAGHRGALTGTPGQGVTPMGVTRDERLEGRYPEGGDRDHRGREAMSASVPYKPRKWLLPGYWLPFDMGDGVGLGIGISTAGGDLLSRHVYDAGLLYDLYDESVKCRFDYLYNTSLPFSFFASASVVERTPFDGISPGFASYQGVQLLVRGNDAAVRSELGVILEYPYLGPNLLLEYSSLKAPLRWMGPERGVRFRQEAFLNLREDDFLILTDTFSLYVPLIGSSVFSSHLTARGGAGERRNPVVSGSSGGYEYVPLNGILTLGYPDPVGGQLVLDLRAKLDFPVLSLERGVHTFPLFLQGIACGILLDNGIVFSSEGGTPSAPPPLATGLSEFLENPARFIRTSLGLEARVSFLVGYEFPLDASIGYAFALSEGGIDGLYGSLVFDFSF